MYQWHDFVGNIGVAFIISTYLLLILKRIKSTSIRFAVLNSVGAIFVIISLIFEFNLSAFIVEFFWLVISLFGIKKALDKKNKNSES